uniref:Uncharacterized protein n=1 Tax=Physcomitrium patens TaxID=3218 RepID=A0A7I3ZWC7_PHYPA
MCHCKCCVENLCVPYDCVLPSLVLLWCLLFVVAVSENTGCNSHVTEVLLNSTFFVDQPIRVSITPV